MVALLQPSLNLYPGQVPPRFPTTTNCTFTPPLEDESTSTELVTTSPGSACGFFSGQTSPYDAKLSTPSGHKPAISTSQSLSHKFTSGSESASESTYGYTSASRSESAATGLSLSFRIRMRSRLGNLKGMQDDGFHAMATMVHM